MIGTMNVRRAVLAVLLALASGCGGKAGETTSAGAILYWHSELLSLGQCEGTDLVVALTPGAQQVQLLRYSSPTAIASETLGPPGDSCVPAPVQMAAVDVDGDGTLDVVISDSSCGSWYALQGPDCSMHSHAWADAFPPADPMPWMAAGGSPPRLLTASDGSLAVFERPAAMSSWQAIPSQGPAAFSLIGQTTVSDVAFFLQDPSSQATAVVFQQGEGASLFAIDQLPGAMTTLASPLRLDQQRLQYLRPFWALDQLRLIPDVNCGQQALAVGIFQSDDGTVPHRLQWVQFAADGFSTIEISQDDARGFAMHVDELGTVRVALVAKGPASDLTVRFGRLDKCSTLTVEASGTRRTRTAGATSENDGMVFVGPSGAQAVMSYDGTSATTCTNDAGTVTCASVTPDVAKTR